MNNWMKYMGLMTAFTGIGTKVYMWLKQTQADGSPGGDDITAEEAATLSPIITEALNAGLQSADVPLMAEVKLIYIGD